MFPILGRKEKAIYTEKEGNVGICNLKKISCVVSFPSPSFSSIRESFAIICCARNMARISASLDLINSLVAANNPASFRDRDLDAAKSSALTNFNNNRGRKGEFGTYRSSSSTNPFSSIILARSTVYRKLEDQSNFDRLVHNTRGLDPKLPCFAWKTLSSFAIVVAFLFERKEEEVDYPKPMKRKVRNIFGIFLSYKTRWKECFVEIIVYWGTRRG